MNPTGNALSLLSNPPERSGGTEQDSRQIQHLLETWLNAYVSGDVDAMMAMVNEDSMLLPQGQKSSAGIDAVRRHIEAGAGAAGVTLTNDTREIRINGTWAMAHGNFALEVAPAKDSEPPFRRTGRYLVLYEKNAAGEWFMLRDIDNDGPVE